MSHTYFFPEPGTISGIPGTFAGVQVEVDEDKSEVVKVSPLARHPHFQPSQETDEQASEPEQAELSEQEASPPEQATEAVPPELPPEQPAQVEAPTDVAPPADEAGSHTESEN